MPMNEQTVGVPRIPGGEESESLSYVVARRNAKLRAKTRSGDPCELDN
jgi:hypothetical protein